MMNNERGSILVITSGFVLVFTLLGLAAIHLAQVNNEMAEKQATSAQSIWVADGGIEVGKANIDVNNGPSGVATGNPPAYPTYSNNFGIICSNTSTVCENYLAHMEKIINPQTGTFYNYRWKTISAGTVSKGLLNTQNTKTRTIEAVISRFNVTNAVTTNGTINNGTCSPDGSSQINGTCEQNAGISLLSIFGLTYTNDRNGHISITDNTKQPPVVYTIDNSYTDNNYKNKTYSGLSVITSNNGVSGNKISNTSTSPVFLIVDCPSSLKSACFDSSGNNQIYGVVWVIGNISITGTPQINGSLFVEGTLDAKTSGNNVVNYDESMVNAALNSVGGGSLKKATIISWKED